MRAPAATSLLIAGIVAASCRAASREAPAGCRSDSPCPAGEYCEYTPGLCGKGRKPGTCRPKPAACDEPYGPVCGCDGRTYESACAAHAAGVDLAVAGGCKTTIAGWAPCGRRYCDVRTSYCEIFLSDVLEPPSDYFCRPLPPACVRAGGATGGAGPTCDCFPPDTRCRSFCGPLGTAPGAPSGFHLTCQGRRPPTE